MPDRSIPRFVPPADPDDADAWQHAIDRYHERLRKLPPALTAEEAGSGHHLSMIQCGDNGCRGVLCIVWGHPVSPEEWSEQTGLSAAEQPEEARWWREAHLPVGWARGADGVYYKTAHALKKTHLA